MEKYIRAEMEVVAFEVEDVITTSVVVDPVTPPNNPGGNEPNCPNHTELYQPNCPQELPMD